MPVEPHPAGDRVDGVVAADVLDEHQDLGAGVARWSRARSRGPRRPACRSSRAGARGRAARRASSATAWRRPAAGRRRSRPSGRRTPCPGRSRWSWCASPSSRRGRASPSRVLTATASDVPVDLHRDDVLDRVDQPLVAQVADGRAPRARRPASSASGAPACRRRASADARRRSASRATAPCLVDAPRRRTVAGRAASVTSGRYGAAGACVRTALTPSPRRRRRAASV